MVTFKPKEKLLRAVRNKPNLWKKDGHLSPVAFKTRSNEKGTSVFRQADRSLEDSVQDVSQRLEGAIVSVTYDFCECFKINVAETDCSTHHCELTNGESTDNYTALTSKQCQELSDNAVVEKRDDDK